MGLRGPIPKRHDQRAGHRSTAELHVDVVGMAAAVRVPPADPGWHPKAAAWYLSLQESGASRYYEPSDWMQAHVLADVLHQLMDNGYSAGLFAAWLSGVSALGVTEGDRRRMKIEVNRVVEGTDPQESARVEAIDEYRRLASG